MSSRAKLALLTRCHQLSYIDTIWKRITKPLSSKTPRFSPYSLRLILRQYTDLKSPATLHRLVNDLVASKILGKLERGKYYINDTRVDDFTKATIFIPFIHLV